MPVSRWTTGEPEVSEPERDDLATEQKYDEAARTALENWRRNRDVATRGGVTALTLSEEIVEQARLTGLDEDEIAEHMRRVLTPEEMAMWEGES